MDRTVDVADSECDQSAESALQHVSLFSSVHVSKGCGLTQPLQSVQGTRRHEHPSRYGGTIVRGSRQCLFQRDPRRLR